MVKGLGLISWICLAMLLIVGCTPESKSTYSLPTTDKQALISNINPTTLPSPSISSKKNDSQNSQQQNDEFIGDPHYINQLFGWQRKYSGRVFVTRDQGKHWIDVTPKNQKGEVTGSQWIPYFLDNNHGWMVLYEDRDQRVTTYSTDDGGISWIKREKSTIHFGDGGIFIQFTDASHGIIETLSAGNCTLKGELLITKDKGDNWTNNGDLPFGGEVFFTTSKIGWLAGGPRGGCRDDEDVTKIWFYKTIDGGKKWNPLSLTKPSDVTSSKKISSHVPQFFNSRLGIMSVYFEEQNVSYIYRTNDGGVIWRPIGHVKGYNPQFSDLLHGSLNENGVVKWKTIDGGRTWEKE